MEDGYGSQRVISYVFLNACYSEGLNGAAHRSRTDDLFITGGALPTELGAASVLADPASGQLKGKRKTISPLTVSSDYFLELERNSSNLSRQRLNSA